MSPLFSWEFSAVSISEDSSVPIIVRERPGEKQIIGKNESLFADSEFNEWLKRLDTRTAFDYRDTSGEKNFDGIVTEMKKILSDNYQCETFAGIASRIQSSNVMTVCLPHTKYPITITFEWQDEKPKNDGTLPSSRDVR